MDEASSWNNWILIFLIFFPNSDFLNSFFFFIGYSHCWSKVWSIAFSKNFRKRTLGICPKEDPAGKTIKWTTSSSCCLLHSQAAAQESIFSVSRDCKRYHSLLVSHQSHRSDFAHLIVGGFCGVFGFFILVDFFFQEALKHTKVLWLSALAMTFLCF